MTCCSNAWGRRTSTGQLRHAPLISKMMMKLSQSEDPAHFRFWPLADLISVVADFRFTGIADIITKCRDRFRRPERRGLWMHCRILSPA